MVLWLGLRSVTPSPGAARWLRFALPFRLRLAFLLIPGLPAVLDLRQQGPDLLYIAFTPKTNPHPADHCRLGRWNLLGLDVASQSRHSYTQFSSDLLSGKRRHSGQIVPDRITGCQIPFAWKIQGFFTALSACLSKDAL